MANKRVKVVFGRVKFDSMELIIQDGGVDNRNPVRQ
jgi:hypothetical protein